MKAQLLGPDGRPIRSAMRGGRLMAPSGYEGARHDRQQTAGWSSAPLPSVTETATRDQIAARARDLTRNSGVAAGALRKARSQTVGVGLTLRSKPDAGALGVDSLEALQFGRQIERVWRRWANDPSHQCDIKRRRPFGQILRTLWSERFVSGENIAVLRWRPDRGTSFATCVQDVDSDRLCNPQDRPDEELLSQGIEFSEDGEALAFHFRDSHRFDYRWSSKRWTWTRLERVAENGRLQVVHGFDADRAEQIRGVSVLAPIIIGFRDLQRFTEAEIGAATINAMVAAFIKSGFDPLAVADALNLDQGVIPGAMSSWQDTRMSMYGERGISINDNRIAFLAPGDEFEMNNTSRNVGAFKDFKRAFLQDFSAALGIPYTVLSEDWVGSTYSSARAALAEAWRIVTEDRAAFIADTVAPIFGAVILEAFQRGYLIEPDGWPPFEEEMGAYLNASWTGPGRGYVDPLKESQSGELQMQMGINTLDSLSAEQGRDWEETIAQRAIERDVLRSHGFAPLELSSVLGTGAPGAGAQQEEGEDE